MNLIKHNPIFKTHEKVLLLFILIFLALFSTVYYITQVNLDNKIDYSKQTHLHNLQVNYQIWTKNQSTQADIIYDMTVKKTGVRELISKAWNTKNKSKRDKLRSQLIDTLSADYNIYMKKGLLQYHIVFPDNIVFLRMHKTDKYGDDLSKIRQDFAQVNISKEIIRGFSEGRTAHAIRNVYPIFDKNGKHIAAIEISYPTELFQQKLNAASEIHTHYLVKKSIFESKAWKRDDRVLNYEPSIEHKDYLMTISTSHNPNNEDSYKKHLKQKNKELSEMIENKEMFSLFSSIGNDVQIISFLPVFQNTTNKLAAWLVSYQKDHYLVTAIEDTLYARLIGTIFIILLLIFIWFIMHQKDRLSQLLNSYDKNVIFSETDIYGHITHVSSAFCEISGYNEDELLGKSHNIIRHPDMQKDIFSDMWKTIKSGKHWTGEVKNQHKDGSYYWVKADIEPKFDNKSNIVGYRAVRHNISDTKDIEDIQKEIIFTMGSIGESRSKETSNHVKRVAGYSKLLAKLYGLNKDEVEMLHMASPMHDIGKVAIPDNILLKPGILTDEEYEIMKSHAEKGYDMLKHSNRPLINTAAIVAHEHHEKWDGTGYPRAIQGENIHIYGRITALVDVYDALISDRVYKKAWEEEKVLNFIKSQSAKHFDPKLVDIFLKHYNEFKKIGIQFKD